MATYLITGASRGIGLELTRQLIALPASQVSKVFATVRGDSPKLNELSKGSSGRIAIVKLDATNEASVKAAAAEVESNLAGKGLDVLINNAGKMGFTPVPGLTAEDLQDHFLTNVVSVQLVTKAFLPLLKKGDLKKIANVTSTFGSIALAPQTHLAPSPAYKVSKAALNMLTVQYALEYGKEGFTIFAVSPGWLRTDLGGDQADLPVEVGTKATLDKIFAADKEQNGKFLNIKVDGWEKSPDRMNFYDGADAPW